MSANGGVIGPPVFPLSTAASGVWRPSELNRLLRLRSSGTEDDRPTTGFEGMIYSATDTGHQFHYTGGVWVPFLAPGTDKETWGAFSDANYLSAPSGAANGPVFSNPYTLAIGLHVISLPTTTGKLVVAYSEPAGPFTTGWYFGGSTANSNKFRMGLKGVNSSADNEFSSMSALSTGAHAIAVKYDGSNLSYSYDGATVTNISTTGTMTAAGASAVLYVGRWSGNGFGSDWCAVAWIRGFSLAASDADLQVLSASPSTYIPPKISSQPAYDWQARWFFAQVASQTTIMAAKGSASSSTTYVQTAGTVAKTSR